MNFSALSLMMIAVAEGGNVGAPKGFILKMTVDGAERPVEAGSYTGKIVLLVIPGA